MKVLANNRFCFEIIGLQVEVEKNEFILTITNHRILVRHDQRNIFFVQKKVAQNRYVDNAKVLEIK